MDSHYSASAAPLTSRARLERISEPWAFNRYIAIGVTLALAILLGCWAANGEFENLILLAVWLTAVMIIVFVQDHWWSPALVITALSFTTFAAGFPMTGMEIGVVILSLTFPVKMAMKTLRKAEPDMSPGLFFWALLGYLVIHGIVILFYSKIEGVGSLKNIVRAYYAVITPLVFYCLLFRYCHARTVRPALTVIYFTTFFAVIVSCVTMHIGISIAPLSLLRISIGCLDPDGADGILRGSAPILFIASVAFWPVVRRGWPRLVLVLAAVIGLYGTMLGGGRLSFASCIMAGFIFAVARGKILIAIPFLVLTLLVSAVMSADPELAFSLPENIQRALTPLNFSEQKTEIQGGLDASNAWHRDLRDRSIGYWTQDTTSFWVGHGYKAWDESESYAIENNLGISDEQAEQTAIEMGRTENMFSGMTNIFGLAGFLLYIGFLLHLAWTVFRACRIIPPGSDARAFCEFSLVGILMTIVLCPFAGGAPNLSIAYWALGLVAARPYLFAPAPAKPLQPKPELPSFIPKSLRPASQGS